LAGHSPLWARLKIAIRVAVHLTAFTYIFLVEIERDDVSGIGCRSVGGAPTSSFMVRTGVRFSAAWVVAVNALLLGCSAGNEPSTSPPPATGAGASAGVGASGGKGGAAGTSSIAVGGTDQSGGSAGSSAATGGTGGVIGTGGAGGGVELPPNTDKVELLPAGVRRLTNDEYASSVRALLGVELPADISLPPDARQSGFTRNTAQRVDPVLAKQLDAIATIVADAARPNFGTLAPCAMPAGSDECASSFIGAFSPKAYRRPVTAEETSSMLALYQVGAMGGTYEDGIALVIRGLLQSAGFLYITEIGDGTASDPIALSPRELASSLSYLITAQPPDDLLIQAAEAGLLATPEGRVQEAGRLLNTGAPARATVLRMLREWIGVDAIAETGKDSNVYPAFTPEVRVAMGAEAEAFMNAVVTTGGTVGDLLGADWTMVDADLAPIYGVTYPGGGGFQRVSLADTRRRGILNQGAFLSVFAHASESAPVLRGVALLERIVCQPPASPATIDRVIPPPPQPDATNTTRERFEMLHSTDPFCAGCHSTIDALGFSFEAFDGMGQYRTMENQKPINSITSVTSDMGMDFSGTYADSAELATALSASSVVRACFARHLFRSAAAASGVTVQPSEDAFVAAWQADAVAEQGGIVQAITNYVASPLFMYRRAQ